MGNAGRFACVFLPMALSLGTLICLVIVALGGQNSSSSLQSDVYFLKANTSGITTGTTGLSIAGVEIGPQVAGTIKQIVNVADMYYIYLWNYCSGPSDGSITYCSPRTSSFWFNPQEVWGLSDTLANQIFPSELKDGLSAYQKCAHFAFIAYVVAFATTCATLFVGIFAICSRWGSFVTAIVAGVSTLFTVAWAGTETGMYAILSGSFDSAFKEYNVQSTMGRQGLAVTWLAVAFSIVGGLFWTISICCCSGRSSGNSKAREDKVYERVPSPYGSQQAWPAQTMYEPQYYGRDVKAGYEPFRQSV